MLRIALVAVAKNEAATIKEWLAFHGASGFTHAIIYDNNSTDATRSEALKAQPAISVEVRAWPYAGDDYQIAAYDDAAARAGDIDWLAFFDCDEFLICPRDGSADAMLKRLADESALAINWAVFGSSGHESRPSGLVTENYYRRATDAFPVNTHTKMLVRPSAYERAVNPHFMSTTRPAAGVDGRPIVWEAEGRTVGLAAYHYARLNHYFVRSREEWQRKLARGYNNDRREVSDFLRYDRNEVDDSFAVDVGAELRRRFAFLEAPEPSPRPVSFRGLPLNFEPSAYLRCNPDVAAAGVDPVDHYLSFGEAEGRTWDCSVAKTVGGRDCGISS